MNDRGHQNPALLPAHHVVHEVNIGCRFTRSVGNVRFPEVLIKLRFATRRAHEGDGESAFQKAGCREGSPP